MRYVLGIDAGGTKTVGLLAGEAGEVVAEARGGGANLQTHGELEVEKVLYGIMETLTAEREASAVCMGIAGVDRPQDEAVIRTILRRLGHGETARVVNDAVIALVAGAPERVGIVILAGSGSIAYGVDREGRTARAGGYGPFLADEGSASWLGREALRAAVRASDGRGQRTLLSSLVLESLGARGVSDLLPLIYEKRLAQDEIASLAALVQRAAEEGDAVAARLLDQAADELATAARAVALQLGLSVAASPYPLVLAGGLFRACPSLAGRLARSLDLPGADLRLLELEPARGAVTLALELLR